MQELIEGGVDESLISQAISHTARGNPSVERNVAPPLFAVLSALERALSTSFRSSWIFVLRICARLFEVSVSFCA